MERTAAVELFKRSVSFGLKYRIMVSDGDSKAYLDVIDVYGVCDSCKAVKQKFTNVRDSKFSDWVRSDEYAVYVEAHESSDSTCCVVYKRDCVNHISKNFRKALESYAKSGEKVGDMKSIIRSKHGLGTVAIVKLSKRFRAIIITHKVQGQHNEVEVKGALLKMKAGIMASLYHSTMIEDDVIRHRWCPEGESSWCPWRRGVKNWEGDRPHHLNPALFPGLLKIYEASSSENYLRRVVTGYNQNALESVNKLIWANVSKAKFHGYKRVFIATGLALLQFEKGRLGQIMVQKQLGIPVTEYQLASPRQWTMKGYSMPRGG